jgi:electron transfer flavoprotein alpha subunit
MATRIWSVAQRKDGQITRNSWETIAAAQHLANLLGEGAQVEAIVLGTHLDAAAQDLSRAAVARVLAIEHPALEPPTPGALVGALAAAWEKEKPDYLIFPHTYQTVDYAPRLAQRIGAALVPEVIGIEKDGGSLVWRRPIMGGKLQARVRIKGEGTAVVSLQAGAFTADSAVKGQSTVERFDVSGLTLTPDREILEHVQAASDKIDLTKADIIVAVGRGIGGPEKLGPIEELARALGAEIGASRPVIDNGWLPRDRQIGSSGQTVAPKIYLALGISGAIQHLVGMKGSNVVVAINKDPSAPIFALARYGIVGDLEELVPALTAAVKASA